MARAKKQRYVDVSNPSLAVDCPRCGLVTARFIDQCRNCGYKLWPSSEMASAAFRAWQAADPERRSEVSRFDLALPQPAEELVDYEARAHHLGIHLFPSSNWPFVICFGVIGGVIFLIGVGGWVLVEDVKMYPSDVITGDEVHH